MAEISALTQRAGGRAGAALAEDAVVDGVTYRALGQHAWKVTPNGKAANAAVPIAEYRMMTGDKRPVPPYHREGLVLINISPARPLHDPETFTLKEIEPYLGLRRTVVAERPDTSPYMLWLPAPYEGTINCFRNALANRGDCQLRLNRGSVTHSVTVPAEELAHWREKVVAFEQLMDRSRVG